MKYMLKIIPAIVIVAALAISCKNDDNNDPPQQTTVQQTKNIAQDGAWKITYFFDSDEDETGDFAGYVFDFNENGALSAVKSSTTVTGTWSVTDSNSNDDDGGYNDLDFNIFFASPPDFEDLSDDWDIVSISNSKIELIDVSGGNGGTDYLTFEKN